MPAPTKADYHANYIASQLSDQLAVIMHHASSNTKKYEFNVTWRANSEPYFDISTHTQVFRVGQDGNVTFPVAIDDEGDTIHYFVTNSTLPGSVTIGQGDSSSTRIEFAGITSAMIGMYALVLEI